MPPPVAPQMKKDPSAPPTIKEARKAESIGLVAVGTTPAVPPQKPAGPPPAMLPEGWTEETDPSSGKKYYYNNKNGESSWVRPK